MERIFPFISIDPGKKDNSHYLSDLYVFSYIESDLTIKWRKCVLLNNPFLGIVYRPGGATRRGSYMVDTEMDTMQR